MNIQEAQLEMRARFCGGFYGQLVSGILWLVSAALATWSSQRAAITVLVVGGFFIFLITEFLVRACSENRPFSAENSLYNLGMQVAFVLPLSMPLLLPVSLYRINLFFPAMTILLGAHYCPFVFLYGMKMFAILAALLVSGGVIIAMYMSRGFSLAAWYTGVVLLLFAVVGKLILERELSARAAESAFRSKPVPAS